MVPAEPAPAFAVVDPQGQRLLPDAVAVRAPLGRLEPSRVRLEEVRPSLFRFVSDHVQERRHRDVQQGPVQPGLLRDVPARRRGVAAGRPGHPGDVEGLGDDEGVLPHEPCGEFVVEVLAPRRDLRVLAREGLAVAAIRRPGHLPLPGQFRQRPLRLPDRLRLRGEVSGVRDLREGPVAVRSRHRGLDPEVEGDRGPGRGRGPHGAVRVHDDGQIPRVALAGHVRGQDPARRAGPPAQRDEPVHARDPDLAVSHRRVLVKSEAVAVLLIPPSPEPVLTLEPREPRRLAVGQAAEERFERELKSFEDGLGLVRVHAAFPAVHPAGDLLHAPALIDEGAGFALQAIGVDPLLERGVPEVPQEPRLRVQSRRLGGVRIHLVGQAAGCLAHDSMIWMWV